MSETEADKLDQAVECFKAGMSLADSATRYGLSLETLEAEVERRAKAKRNETMVSTKTEFLYESAQMEDAVNSVLCGTSIKDAAAAYGVSKNALKQALRQELDKEPLEEGSLVAEELGTDDASDLYRNSPQPDSANFSPNSGVSSQLPGVLVIEPLKKELGHMKLTPKEELGDEIPVHCGNFMGTLHRDRFYCPGLRAECIQLAEGRWVTPKTFSIIGGKASLKNWKNAVRINNVSLRHYMDAGYVDFYDHETNCSGKCSHKSGGSLGKYQSRINSMRMKSFLEGLTEGDLIVLSDDDSEAQDLQVQEELQGSGSGTNTPQPQAAVSSTTKAATTTATHGGVSADDPPALLQFTENIAASPAFTVLRQAQGRAVGTAVSAGTASQPVFPAPMPLSQVELNKVAVQAQHELKQTLRADQDDEVTVTGMSPASRVKTTSLLPANLTELTQQINKTRQAAGNVAPQTIIVRPLGQPDGARPNPVTYLVPTSATGSRIQLPANTVMIPINSSTNKQAAATTHTFTTAAAANTTTTTIAPSSFPDIENIMRDSGHFWKGIVEIGLLENVVHDMKVQLSCIKRRALSTPGGLVPADAKALSKVASGLGLQDNIRFKLSEKKDDMKRQNDRIQNEIDELRRKMAIHEQRRKELKRKSDRFDELMAKRPHVQLDSSDEEDEWTTTDKSDTARTSDVDAAGSVRGLTGTELLGARLSTITSIRTLTNASDGEDKGGSDRTETNSESGQSSSLQEKGDRSRLLNILGKTGGRSSRKQFIPMKKPVMVPADEDAELEATINGDYSKSNDGVVNGQGDAESCDDEESALEIDTSETVAEDTALQTNGVHNTHTEIDYDALDREISGNPAIYEEDMETEGGEIEDDENEEAEKEDIGGEQSEEQRSSITNGIVSNKGGLKIVINRRKPLAS